MSQAAVIMVKEWALALPVMLVLLAPGLGPAWVFARKRSLPVSWMILLAFAWGVAWVSVAGICAYLMRWSLSVVVWAYAAAIPVSVALIVADIRKKGLPGELDADRQGLGIAVAAWITALVQGPQWFGTPDNYYHLAASRSLLVTGRPIVTDPFFGLETRTPDATAGMWNTMQAVVSRLVVADVASVYTGLTAFSACAVVLAFWLLARELSESPGAASVATLAYFVAAWYTDFRPFGYPNKVSIALAFIVLAIIVRVVREPRAGWVLAMGVTGLSVLAVHLASAEMELLCAGGVVVSCLALSLVRSSDVERKAARAAAGRVAAGVALMLAPVLPVLVARVIAAAGSPVMGRDSFGWAGDDVLAGPWGMRLVTPGGFGFGGPWHFWLTLALAVLALIYMFRFRDRTTAVLVPIVLMVPVLTVFPPVSTFALNTSSYMVARMVELFRFAPFIAAAWGLGRLERWSAGSRAIALTRALSALLIVTTLIIALPYVISTYWQGKGLERRGSKWSFSESWKRDMRKVFGFAEIFEMRRLFGDTYPRVLSDDDTTYHLMGLVPISVVASLPTHTPVFLPASEVFARNEDVKRFFGETASHQERAAILKRWDVDYVVVRDYMVGVNTRQAIMADTNLFERVLANDEIILLRVNRSAVDAAVGGQR